MSLLIIYPSNDEIVRLYNETCYRYNIFDQYHLIIVVLFFNNEKISK